MGADGEGHPKQARLQGQISRARVSRGTRGYTGPMRPRDRETRFFMTLSAVNNVFDAQSAYLQSDGIERLLLLRIPYKKNPPLGTKPGQVFVATGSIHGTRDAGCAWYEHSKQVLEAAGCRGVESGTRPSLPAWTPMDSMLSRTRMSMIS